MGDIGDAFQRHIPPNRDGGKTFMLSVTIPSTPHERKTESRRFHADHVVLLVLYVFAGKRPTFISDNESIMTVMPMTTLEVPMITNEAPLEATTDVP